MLDPVPVAGLTEVVLPTATALADGRAVYGGLTLGLGLFFGLCATRADMYRSGLWAMLLSLAGPATGRAMGVFLDGAANTETLRTLTVEATLAGLAAFALARSGSAMRP